MHMSYAKDSSTNESLRKAIAWIAEQGGPNQTRIEEAARIFDLSPRDEEFLERYFQDVG